MKMWTKATVIHAIVIAITVCTWISAIVFISIQRGCTSCEVQNANITPLDRNLTTRCTEIIRVSQNGSIDVDVCNIGGFILIDIKKKTRGDGLILNVKDWLSLSRMRVAIGNSIAKLRHLRDKKTLTIQKV